MRNLKHSLTCREKFTKCTRGKTFAFAVCFCSGENCKKSNAMNELHYEIRFEKYTFRFRNRKMISTLPWATESAKWTPGTLRAKRAQLTLWTGRKKLNLLNYFFFFLVVKPRYRSSSVTDPFRTCKMSTVWTAAKRADSKYIVKITHIQYEMINCKTHAVKRMC